MFIALLLIVVLPASGIWQCAGKCGWSQTTDSPLVYPSDGGLYSNNASCKWTITAPSGYRIRTKTTQFYLHSTLYDKDGGCRDAVWFEVSGWKSPPDCRPPPPIETPGEVMAIGFRSDGEGVAEGFTITFDVFQGPINWNRCGDVDLLPGDNVTLEEQYGRKTSMDCKWRVSAPPGMLVEARISRFAIWSSQSDLNPCTQDYLQVSPIGGDSVKYCGDYRYSDKSLLERLISSGNKMEVKLHTVDYVGNFGGFRIEFGAFKADSVVVQQILNLHDHWHDNGYKVQANAVRARNMRISLNSESRQIRFHYGLVAQLVHTTQNPVNITIRTYHEKTVTFESAPDQSWIVLQDGIYKQDGSTNLSATNSKTADFKWEERGN